MTTYHYRAKNSLGENLEGEVDTASITEAVREIQGRGLELVSIEEVKEQLQEFGQYLFDAVDRRGEPVRGTIQGETEEQVRQMLQQEFGYQVKEIKRKLDAVEPEAYLERPEPVTAAATAEPVEEKKDDEGIIFSHKPRAVRHRQTVISDEELNSTNTELQGLIEEGSEVLNQTVIDRIKHLQSMIELVRENQSKQRWKNLKREIKKVTKLADQEIKAYQDKKWKAFEAKNPAQKVDSYQDFSQPEPAPQAAPSQPIPQTPKAFRRSFWQVIDLPNEADESEVLIKQQYESAWAEVQRFSSVLMVFYLACAFAGYYLMRSGISDHFMTRIYDTLLFKQITLGLFAFTSLVTLRVAYLNGRIVSDAAICTGIVVSLGLVFL